MKKMTMKARVLAVACAAVMAVSVFALAGCGGGGSDSGSSSGGSSSGGSSSSSDSSSSGGSTAPAKKTSYAITDQRAITWTDSIGSTWVQVIVEITNDGTNDLYLGSGSCDLEDANGKLIKSMSLVSEYPEVLAPGEKGYMYEETTLDNPVDGEITVLPRVDAREAKVECIRLATSDVAVSDDSWGEIKVMGRVENTTDEEQSMVQVVGLLYGADGKLLGTTMTYIMEDLKPGDKIGFEMGEFSMPDSVTASAVANCVVYAYPNQFQF